MMNSREFNPDFFTAQLEQILSGLRQEIEHSIPSPPLLQGGSEELDNYIFELNSFYYRSFTERLFPLYHSSVQEEVSRLLKLSRQESMVKMDIMANIKRYAKLYNQVKSILSICGVSRENTGQALLTISREQDHRAVELLYTLKQLENEFIDLQALFSRINTWLEDGELMFLVQTHPAAISALQVVSSLDRNNPLQADAINRLLVYLAYPAKTLSRIQPRQDSKQISGIIEEMRKRAPVFSRIPETETLINFYEVQVKSRISLYLDVIQLGLASEQPELLNRSIRDLENFLTGLSKLIEKAFPYTPALSGAANLNNVLVDSVEKLHDDTSNILKAITSITSELSGSGEPDFAYFSAKIQEILQPARSLLKNAVTAKELTCFPELLAGLECGELQLSLLTARIDLLNQKQEHHNEVLKHLLTIVNMLDNYLNLLANIRADLERILAPRNISRAWKEVNVKVDRVPLQKGQVFPLDYLYLLDKHLVETRLCQDGQEDNLILHEEGDLFIIRVDELLEEEMPYLVIAQKG
ncbi:MAG: hypothetical protein PHW39_08745 [Syntrophomonadaceae bacterium]|nr:hypothetical protein [Syntrophomonadaceae bacterium]